MYLLYFRDIPNLAARMLPCGHGHVTRVRTAFRTLLLRTFDRLDCAANAKIGIIGILCILAASGGVHALT